MEEIIGQISDNLEEYTTGGRKQAYIDGVKKGLELSRSHEISENKDTKDASGTRSLECSYCGQTGFSNKQGLGSHEKYCEENPEGGSKAKEATEVNIEERYPLDRDTLKSWNDRRLEYELVILFNSKDNSGPMTTFEVMEAIWGWGNIDSQQYEYKRVQRLMEESRQFKSKDLRPKKYFLSPGRDELEVDEEVIRE